MYCLIPFAADQPNTRLEPVLSPADRRSFATAMLADVLDAADTAGVDPTVVSTAPIDDNRVTDRAAVTVDDRTLTAMVNARLADGEPTLVVMADLPLVRGGDIRRLADSDADVTIAPGLGGGTNALAVREPRFRVDYHGASYLDHRRAAADLGASVETVDSRRLATDIDTPADLAELLIHGTGLAHDWLADAGFELETSDGRVGIRRPE